MSPRNTIPIAIAISSLLLCPSAQADQQTSRPVFAIETISQLEKSYLFKSLGFKAFYSNKTNSFFKDKSNMYAICILKDPSGPAIQAIELFNLRQSAENASIPIQEGFWMLTTDMLYGNEACIRQASAVEEMLGRKQDLLKKDTHEDVNGITVSTVVRQGSYRGLELIRRPGARWKCPNIPVKCADDAKIASLFTTDATPQPVSDPQQIRITQLTGELCNTKKALLDARSEIALLETELQKTASRTNHVRSNGEASKLKEIAERSAQLEKENKQKDFQISDLRWQLEQSQRASKQADFTPTLGVSIPEDETAPAPPPAKSESEKYLSPYFNPLVYCAQVTNKIRTDLYHWDLDKESGTVNFTVKSDGSLSDIVVQPGASEQGRKRLAYFIAHCAPFPARSGSSDTPLGFTAKFNGQSMQLSYQP